jgi:hypothetical protein
MLSAVSSATFDRLTPELGASDKEILSDLPGTMPEESELRRWIAVCGPTSDE